MREMKPLILPKLVAARKSSKSSLDMSEPASSVYSCADSGFYSASDCSTPPTPSHSSRGHIRYPSSISSLSSSPPAHDPFEGPNASGKLPKLTEEPVERDDEYVTVSPDCCSCDNYYCGHRPSTGRSFIEAAYDFAEDYLSHESVSHLSKRRRSVESSAHSITNRIETRFPVLTKKVRERKRASTLGRSSRSETPSRVPSRSASLRISSTRSSSISSSIRHVKPMELSEALSASSARGSREQLDVSVVSSPIDIAKANAYDPTSEEEDSERFATTPLLPPLLITARLNELPTQSPLQSPSVADPAQSMVTTPIGTPPVRAYPTPPLSSRPSVASFKASRPGVLVPSGDIPPILLTDKKKKDEWADKLSHANFTIQPEPYIPELCDSASLRQLFADWEQARCNFTKHQVRTGEHYGATSKIYKLTEEKWEGIDKMWREYNQEAISRATALGEEPEPQSPVEPAPLSKMPTLNDPQSAGKFPKLGDEDIVGPMVQIASQLQKTPTRKRAFFKFLSDMKFPGSFFGRSSAGIRGR
ncbi:hypothetical protein K491DRAFT_677735 [Lophiostoma macrostomum CBS 122681]|uniref:Only prolin and serin are matching in the corresponding protein n=1 Tax=Lophiostoma macrostomum CBS 122681 TaxID=1314788 RepID=A0A6A6TDS0_9PLEO|nr:hypothetical protein K491DRAFT_677735 [Lophiostoma macrostomum CBS 122681]